MGKLRAVKPEVKEVGRTKQIIYGREKVGKTFYALDFPNVYYIDVEGGATREQYQEKLLKSGGVYFGQEQGSLDFNTVVEEVKALATEKHNYKTLVIDSFTKLYKTARSIAEEEVGDSFGKDKKEANKPTRRLLRWIDKLDMNVILVCWNREKWSGTGENRQVIGTTFEGFDDFAYELDLLIEAVKNGGKRQFVVKASRIKEMPEGTIGDLNFISFSEVFGIEKLTKEQKPFVPATSEQIGKMQIIIEQTPIPEKKISEWLQKMNCETLSEISFEKAQAFIDGYSKKEAK
jgi:hypothetical protein